MMKVAWISKHFARRWRSVRGTEPPSIEELNQIIAEGILLRHGRFIWLVGAAWWRKRYLLAEIWNHERGLIVKIDERNECAVSFCSQGVCRFGGRGDPERSDTDESP